MKIFEGIKNAIIIDRGRDIVCLLLQGVNGVTHGNTNTCLQNHRGIVATIAKGHRSTGIKALMSGHGQNALTLVGTVGRDIRKLRMPAT